VFAANETRVDRVMDSNDQERERGITILAKAASVEWKGVRINLVDTPGHSDFGGEVERALAMVDGVLLLVDAAEGPLPQTRYVLSKALALTSRRWWSSTRSTARRPPRRGGRRGLPAVLRPRGRRPEHRVPGRLHRRPEGRAMAGVGMPGPDADLAPLLDAIVDTIPAPGRPDAPLQAMVTNLDASDYLGRLAIGRVVEGTLRPGPRWRCATPTSRRAPVRAQAHPADGLRGWAGSRSTSVAGDLFVVAGFPEVEIGDTLADPDEPEAPAPAHVDEPVLRMTFGVNTSPLAGKDGQVPHLPSDRSAWSARCSATSRSGSAPPPPPR
jgi:GTP-binding protein